MQNIAFWNNNGVIYNPGKLHNKIIVFTVEDNAKKYIKYLHFKLDTLNEEKKT